MNAIGMQLRDPINSGLTRWRMAVINECMNAVAERERNSLSKSTRFSLLSMEMSRLTWEGTAEPVSRDQFLRHERGQGNIHCSCSADHVQDWQPYPVDPYFCYMCDHTYMLTFVPPYSALLLSFSDMCFVLLFPCFLLGGGSCSRFSFFADAPLILSCPVEDHILDCW